MLRELQRHIQEDAMNIDGKRQEARGNDGFRCLPIMAVAQWVPRYSLPSVSVNNNDDAG